MLIDQSVMIRLGSHGSGSFCGTRRFGQTSNGRFCFVLGKPSLPELAYLLSCGRLTVTAPKHSTHLLRTVLFHCQTIGLWIYKWRCVSRLRHGCRFACCLHTLICRRKISIWTAESPNGSQRSHKFIYGAFHSNGPRCCFLKNYVPIDQPPV